MLLKPSSTKPNLDNKENKKVYSYAPKGLFQFEGVLVKDFEENKKNKIKENRVL